MLTCILFALSPSISSLLSPNQGVHPRVLTEGFEIAQRHAVSVLERMADHREMDRSTLSAVVHTALQTKLHSRLADVLTEVFRAFWSVAHSVACAWLATCWCNGEFH